MEAEAALLEALKDDAASVGAHQWFESEADPDLGLDPEEYPCFFCHSVDLITDGFLVCELCGVQACHSCYLRSMKSATDEGHDALFQCCGYPIFPDEADSDGSSPLRSDIRPIFDQERGPLRPELLDTAIGRLDGVDRDRDNLSRDGFFPEIPLGNTEGMHGEAENPPAQFGGCPQRPTLQLEAATGAALKSTYGHIPEVLNPFVGLCESPFFSQAQPGGILFATSATR